MSRRPPRLVAESEPPRVWRLRLADGSVREPLNHLHVRALVETGVATAQDQLAGVGEENWQRLGEHALWADVAPPPTTARFSTPAPVDPGIVRNEVHAATPKMQAVWEERRAIARAHLEEKNTLEDRGRFLKALALACAVAGLICVGDIIVFTCQLVVAFVFLAALVRLVALWLVWRVMR